MIDADASTYIMAQDPKQPWEGSDYQKNLMSAPSSVANILRPHGDYAIIGPGGGVDVLRAVANGSPKRDGDRDQSDYRHDDHAREVQGLLVRAVHASECAYQGERWALVGAQVRSRSSTSCR